MSAPKRHHTLPQFYLERFCQDGRLWVFDRETGRFRREQPKNTSVIGHYYSVELADGQKETGIESMLAQLEGETKPLLQTLEDRGTLTEEDKMIVALFIGFLFARVPEFERDVSSTFGGLARHWAKITFSTPERTKRLLETHPVFRG